MILVRRFTEADDVAGFHAARGVLTAEGGKSSHAALIARGMGRPCVAGASALEIDADEEVVRVGETELHAGDTIAIDGSTGLVTVDEVELIVPGISGEFERVLEWADEIRRLGRAGQRRQRGGRRARARLRRRGNRPLSHRAHVLRLGPRGAGPRDVHRRRAPAAGGGAVGRRRRGRARRDGVSRGPRSPRRAPARRLRGDLPRDGGAAGHRAAARSAAARVPPRVALRGRARGRGGGRGGRRGPRATGARSRARGDEPDARVARRSGSRSCSARSTRCRHGRSSRRCSTSAATASGPRSRSCCR